MRVNLVAFDSLGVRSTATYVEAKDVRIFIDPSAALAPIRYGLPPHPKEIEELNAKLRDIERLLRKAEVVINTHYHYDHHDPAWKLDGEIYRDKIVLLKDPVKNINYSQRRRAHRYLGILRNYTKEIYIADSKDFRIGDVAIRFSDPLPHGVNEKLGYVIQVLIDDGHTRLTHSSDVEGPCLRNQIDFIVKWRPNIVVIDGPSTYLAGYRYPLECVGESVRNIKRAIAEHPAYVIIDHHLMRDKSYKNYIKEFSEIGGQVWLGSAASFMGVEEKLLEANRRDLFEEYPVEKSYFTNKNVTLDGD